MFYKGTLHLRRMKEQRHFFLRLPTCLPQRPLVFLSHIKCCLTCPELLFSELWFIRSVGHWVETSLDGVSLTLLDIEWATGVGKVVLHTTKTITTYYFLYVVRRSKYINITMEEGDDWIGVYFS